jgi:hypothetical protein
MHVPRIELLKAEEKCTILAEIDKDFRHVIDDLEQRYETNIRVQIIRPVIGGGAGAERIILVEVQRFDS